MWRGAARSAPVRGRLLSVAPVFARSYRCVLICASDMAAARARKLRAELQAKGHDGILIAEQNVWIAFESGQAKATDNRGTFDRSNPDIRFSLPESTDAQRRD